MMVTDDKKNGGSTVDDEGRCFRFGTLGLLRIGRGAATAAQLRHPETGNFGFPGGTMAGRHRVTINGNSFHARRGELLLDAALSNGIDLPHDCRAGHCGTCCVRLVSGEVRGGKGSEPGIVHACQCRIVGDAGVEKDQASGVRTVEGVLSSMRPLSPEVIEVGIRTDRALPYRARQYLQVRVSGYPRTPLAVGEILAVAFHGLPEPPLQHPPSLAQQAGERLPLVPCPSHEGWVC